MQIARCGRIKLDGFFIRNKSNGLKTKVKVIFLAKSFYVNPARFFFVNFFLDDFKTMPKNFVHAFSWAFSHLDILISYHANNFQTF